MRDDDAGYALVTDAFTEAAFTGEGWEAALDGLARLCGFRVGELVGFGSGSAIAFNFMSSFDPAALAEFAAIDGGNPDVNARVRASTFAPVMTCLTEADFMTMDEYRNDPFYQGFCLKHDISFGCVMPMIRDHGNMVGLAMFRGERQGNATDKERGLFEAVAPHIRDAVRIRARFEEQGALLLKGTLDAMSLGVFICNRYGTIRAMTELAEDALAANRGLRLRQGQLRAVHATEDQILSGAIQLATMPRTPTGRGGGTSTVVVRNATQVPLILDVIPLPTNEHALGFEPRAIVVISERPRDAKRSLTLLQMAYRMTLAEAQIALRLAHGESPEAIARDRGVSIGTVRVQIRSIFVKLGVNRQSELAARLRDLL